MFAGEGGPHRTNKRFKFLSKDSAAKRLSTAFDSVTLYGANPDKRPDIFWQEVENQAYRLQLSRICASYTMVSIFVIPTSVI